MEDFVYFDSWLEKEYLTPENMRYWSFKVALNLLLQRGGKFILETGTTYVGDVGAGASTVIFGKYLEKYGGTLWTIDLSERNIELAKQITAPWSKNINYVVSDSHEYLANFRGTIDLLYLDSYDYPLDGTPPDDCQAHQLKEFQLIEPKLNPLTIVLLDDNMLPGGGKTKLTKNYLREKGWTCLIDYQQSLWIK